MIRERPRLGRSFCCSPVSIFNKTYVFVLQRSFPKNCTTFEALEDKTPPHRMSGVSPKE